MYSQSEPKVININQGLAKIHNHKSFKWSQKSNKQNPMDKDDNK